VERDLIRTRTAEGRSRAKAQRKAHGPPPSLSRKATRRRAQGATLDELACSYNCKPGNDFTAGVVIMTRSSEGAAMTKNETPTVREMANIEYFF